MKKINLEKNGIYDFSDIDADTTYRMAPPPYPPEPSYDFIMEENGRLIKLLEIWDGYFDALFYFAHKENLLDCAFGRVWYDFAWIGDNYSDWELAREDIADFITILMEIQFYEIDTEKESIYLPEIQELMELRDYLLVYFKREFKRSSKIYLHKL